MKTFGKTMAKNGEQAKYKIQVQIQSLFNDMNTNNYKERPSNKQYSRSKALRRYLFTSENSTGTAKTQNDMPKYICRKGAYSRKTRHDNIRP